MIRFPNQVAKRALHFNSSTLDEISRLLHARPRFSLRTEKPHVKLSKFKPPSVSAAAGAAPEYLSPVATEFQGPPLPSPESLSPAPPSPPSSSSSHPPFVPVRVSLSSSTDLPASDPAFVRLAMGSLLDPAAPDGSRPLTRLSAVLLPLCLDAGVPSVLFIQRSRRMRHHRGQAAFPGGMLDPADWGDPVRCAVRETQEEVGVGWGPMVWPRTAEYAGKSVGEASASVLGVGPHSGGVPPAAAASDTSGAVASNGAGAGVDVILLGLHHDCSTVERHRPTGTVITPVVGFLPTDVRSLPLSLSPDELRRVFCVPLEALCDEGLWGEVRGRPSFSHELGAPYRVTVPAPGAAAAAAASTAAEIAAVATEAAAEAGPAARSEAWGAVLHCLDPLRSPVAAAGTVGQDDKRVEIEHVPFVLNCQRSVSDAEGWSDDPYNSEDEDSGRGQRVVVWGATAWMLSVFLKQVMLKIK